MNLIPSTVLAVFIGNYLDRLFSSKHVFLIIFIILGLIAGVRLTIKAYIKTKNFIEGLTIADSYVVKLYKKVAFL